MGALLPKAVQSAVVKRCSGPLFRVGFAEVNGWRKTMEDAHVILDKERWGFFGVFDGHGGSQCSNFIARRLVEELEHGPPADDKGVKELMLRLDSEFLASKTPSGSTGTFAIVTPPGDDGQYRLRIGNIGDSRVLLGRTDGSMVEGAGTDGALTVDHKPDHPNERARIERTGGEVKFVQNVARVNGDLAVSRSFGDAPYKQTGGPAQEDHPVSAEPEFAEFSCDSTHFLALVCDGISEGQFPNREVVKFAAEELRTTKDKPDPGAAAAAVCHKALVSGSNDNLSCMIVLLGGGAEVRTVITLQPGPFTLPNNGSFRKAYAAMAEHAGLSLAEAVEARYEVAQKLKVRLGTDQLEDAPASAQGEPSEEMAPLLAEIALFGEGPPSDLAAGSAERVEWFREWLSHQSVEEDPDPSSMTRDQLVAYAQRYPEIVARLAPGQNRPAARNLKKVRIAPLELLRPAVEAVPTLKWVDQLEATCGVVGEVLETDASDNTSKVLFTNLGFAAWLPSHTVTEIDAQADAAEDKEASSKRPRIS